MHKSQLFILFCILSIILLAIQAFFIKNNINYSDDQQEFFGLIINEPDIRQEYTNLTIQSQKFTGLILARVPLYPEYQYGDLLKINCRLQPPKNSANFDYEKYLAITDIYYLCYQPEIQVLDHSQGNFLISKIYQYKNYCLRIIEKIWVMPVSGFMAGLLLGLKKSLPQEIINDFTITGTIHILVVSGSHLVVFSALLKTILKNLGVNRKKQFYIITGILIFYVFLTGWSAAAVRAGWMAILTMLAEKFGRPKNVFNILVFSCFIMTVQNPRIIFYDVGFQLSFLATVGLVYLSKPIERVLFFMPKFFGVKSLMAQTFAAIICTTPIIWWHFRRISLIAPLANLLIVPLISVVMITGMMTLAVGAVWPPAAQIAGWFVALWVQLILIINHWLAQIPWAQLDLNN